MNFALIGPLELTELDEHEVIDYLNVILDESEFNNDNRINLLAYRSIEPIVFQYFIERPELAPLLTIFTFQTISQLPTEVREAVRFLSSLGSEHISFNINQSIIDSRDTYLNCWEFILNKSDILISFYNNNTDEISKIFSPLTLAKRMNKKAQLYYLPENSFDLYQSSINKKVKIVN